MQSIADFDEVLKAIAVPATRDYSRLSTSPSQYVDHDSSYFHHKDCPPVKCDTPVKMKLPKNNDEEVIAHTNENFLNGSSSGSSISSKSVTAEIREPLKVAPKNESEQLTVDFNKLALFNPKEPEIRLSQRRRSEQKQKEERRSAINSKSQTVSSTNRARSGSVKREGSIPRLRAPSVPRTNPTTESAQRSRSGSVQRAPSVPRTVSTPGVVTRSMAKLTQHASVTVTKSDPHVRRSVMPVKIAAKTPVSNNLQTANDRSRDRTRRVNTTAQIDANTRRSVMTNGTPATAQPKRASSLTRTNPTNSEVTKTRPIATANRSSTLRQSLIKKVTSDAQKPAEPPVIPSRNRVPLRVKPSTPLSTSESKPAFNSASRPIRSLAKPATSSANLKNATSENDLAQKKPISSNYASALFNRLSTPKSGASTRPVPATSTPKQVSSVRRSAVRPVPNYVRKVNSVGLPTGAGTHGIRAPSRGRTPSRDSKNSSATSSQLPPPSSESSEK